MPVLLFFAAKERKEHKKISRVVGDEPLHPSRLFVSCCRDKLWLRHSCSKDLYARYLIRNKIPRLPLNPN